MPEPKLDPQTLRESCDQLRDLLRTYATTEPDAALCLRELMPIFMQVTSGEISKPQGYPPPCGYYFVEGSLRKHPPLEHAFARFSMALQGWDEASLSLLLSKKADPELPSDKAQKNENSKNYLPVDHRRGIPAGAAIRYECLVCGNTLASMPQHSVACACRNMIVDAEAGRVSVKDESKFRAYSTI